MSAAAPTLARPAATTRAWSFVRRNALTAYAMLALAYLFLPIAVVVLFSFNDPAGRFNYTWTGFTLSNWTHPFEPPGIQHALAVSLEIAALSSICATLLGALIGLALVRYAFRGRGAVNLLIFVPMTAPEIVLGASLLTLFLNRGVQTGFTTIFIAHVMFNISYVVVVVKARLVGFDRHLEEAAMDLGATPLQVFWRVTLPLIAPAILSAFLLTFALSIDDFVITYFNAGSVTTFPLYVWGAARVAVPPQINVIGTMIFAVAVTLSLLNIVYQRHREVRAA